MDAAADPGVVGVWMHSAVAAAAAAAVPGRDVFHVRVEFVAHARSVPLLVVALFPACAELRCTAAASPARSDRGPG